MIWLILVCILFGIVFGFEIKTFLINVYGQENIDYTKHEAIRMVDGLRRELWNLSFKGDREREYMDELDRDYHTDIEIDVAFTKLLKRMKEL